LFSSSDPLINGLNSQSVLNKITMGKKLTTFLFLSFVSICFETLAQVHCGTERWDVKSLSDPDTVNINFNQVVISSVHEQICITPPDKVKDIPRRKVLHVLSVPVQ
jgi:hypothetical protein